MQAKHYLIILLFALIGLSNNLQAQTFTEKQIVEKALKVWLENEKIKCQYLMNSNFDDYKQNFQINLSEPLKDYMVEHFKEYPLSSYSLIYILNKRSCEIVNMPNIFMQEGLELYMNTLDSVLVNFSSINAANPDDLFSLKNLKQIRSGLIEYAVLPYNERELYIYLE